MVSGEDLLWDQREGYKYAKLEIRGAGDIGFTRMSSNETGIAFTNQLSRADQAANNNLLNGSGVALGDVDGDGWCDIFLCNLNGTSRLYKNLGQWTFQDITEAAGLLSENQLAAGALIADFTGDGHPDLVVSYSAQSPQLFINDGLGGFYEKRSLTSRPVRLGGTTITAADIDLDGDVDLYVANYGELTIRSATKISFRTVNGEKVVGGRFRNRVKIMNGQLIEYGETDLFLINDGQGNFTELDWLGGRFLDEDGRPLREKHQDFSLSAMFRDINRDGLPDLYVCSDFYTPDRVWINRGNATFQLLPRDAMTLSSQFSMGVDFADIDRDGLDDFFVVDMLSRYHRYRMTETISGMPPLERTLESELDRPQVQRNTFFHQRGGLRFVEMAHYAGLVASDWSWCPIFLDVDLDGYEDLLITNGHAHAMDADGRFKDRLEIQSEAERENRIFNYPALRVPNVAFRNRGDLTFEEVGAQWGFDSMELSMGMACGDLDNDGDLDLVVNTLNAEALVYRNETTRPRIAVQLKAANPARGIGARIELRSPSLTQSQEMIAGGRYLSSDQPLRTFAMPDEGPYELAVFWPDGKVSRFANVKPNRLYEIDETTAGERSISPVPEIIPLFKSHEEQPDPEKERGSRSVELADFSTPFAPDVETPALTWSDIDGPLWDDHPLGLLKKLRKGTGSRTGKHPLDPIGLWITAQSVDMDSDGDDDLLIACLMSGLRYFENDNGILVDQSEKVGLAEFKGLWQCAQAVDMDGDGELDIVAGNWGLNSPYALYAHEPVRLWVNEQAGGLKHFIEGYFDKTSRQWMPIKDLDFFRKAFPREALRFPLHRLYAEASMEELLGESMKDLRVLEMNHFESGIFYRNEGSFEFKAFPREAQWTPVRALAAGDLNQDGFMDLVIGQNISFSSNLHAPMKANGALVLIATNPRSFRALSAMESGVHLNEDIVDVRLVKPNGDEKPELWLRSKDERAHRFTQ